MEAIYSIVACYIVCYRTTKIRRRRGVLLYLYLYSLLIVIAKAIRLRF